jgi:hypothetical protein
MNFNIEIMNRLISYLFPLLIIIAGCSTSRKAAHHKKPHIVKAGYHRWSHVPIHGSTVPEKGTDVALIVKNLPQGATPTSIIYQHRKSFQPNITDTTKTGIVMSARIVIASSVLHDTSKKTDRSDRLIYQKADGTTHSIKIDHWTRVDSSQ